MSASRICSSAVSILYENKVRYQYQDVFYFQTTTMLKNQLTHQPTVGVF